MTASLAMPAHIGRYEIRAVLGRGGMGTVYHAYDPRFERDVALKVLAFHLLGQEGLRARFEREAKTIASLEHPAIVPVYDFDEQEGQPFLVMRLMPGGTLGDRLVQGPLPTAEVARILQRIGSALDEAHAQGIVHRDLKPGNILFDKYNNAYLSDFGIVRLAEGTGIDLTGTGMVGTPGYMSPEQIQGKTIDGRTDIYALGVLVFEMLTASKPFKADTPAMIMMKQITEPIPDIHAFRPDLPPDMDEVIERSLSLQREKRPASAGELVQLLQAAALVATRAADNLAAEMEDDARETAGPPPVPPTTVEPTPPPPPPQGDAPVAAGMSGGMAETVLATPPPAGPPPVAAPATTPPPAAPSRRRWWPALIIIIGLLLVTGAMGIVYLVTSQLAGDTTVVEESSTPEQIPASDLESDSGVEPPPDGAVLEIDRTMTAAYTALEQGDYDEALALADSILEIDPDNLPALEVRHFALRDLGRFDEAIATAERMVALEPENSGFIGELAVTQDWAGDTDAALVTVERCLAQDPEYAGCWFLLGVFRQQQGDLPAAREAWLRALEIEPDNSELNRELAWVILETDNDLDLARQFADRAVEVAPDDAENWFIRGHIAAEVGDVVVALESYRRYLETAPAGECDECVAEAEAFLAEHEAALAAGVRPDVEGAAMFAVMLNIQEPVLADLRVRQALALSLDRNLLAGRAREAGFLDAEPSTAWLHPALLNLDFIEGGLPFTPDMAQFLLAEAGYPAGAGFSPLTLQTNPDPRNELVLLAVQEMWRDNLGIEVGFEIVENPYFERLDQETPPLYRLGYVIGPNETPLNLLHTFFAADGESNFTDYNSSEFDRLLAEAAQMDDPLERRALFIEADNLVTAGDTVVIPLFYHLLER